MILSCATPLQIIEWFQSGQSKADVLCILLAPSSEDRQRVRQLAQDFFRFDALMRERIHFVLSYPGAQSPLSIRDEQGAVAVFPGESLYRPVRGTYAELSGFYESQAIDLIATQMALFVPEFMNILGVEPESLPALCVLVQGQAQIKVIKMDARWNTDDVHSWLLKLAKIAYRPESERHNVVSLNQALVRTRNVICQTADIERAIEARRMKLQDSFQYFASRVRFNDEDKLLIARFLNAGSLCLDSFENMISTLSVRQDQGFGESGPVRHLRKLVRETEQYEERLCNLVESLSVFDSIPAIQEHLAERSRETMRLFNELDSNNSVTVVAHTTSMVANRVEEFSKSTERIISTAKRLAMVGPWVAHLAKLLGVP
jgi:hypothetical protein